MASVTQGERIATLETQVVYLVAGQKDMNSKLDELLELKHKGAGAFWIMTVLSGTALAGVLTWFINLFKGN